MFPENVLAGSAAGASGGHGRDYRFDLGWLDGLAGEPQLEALEEPRNAVRIHLELVTGAKIGECLRLGLGDAAEVDELAEEPLEARGGDDLQDPRRALPRRSKGGRLGW